MNPKIKLIVAILAAPNPELNSDLAEVLHLLSEVFGSIDFVGSKHPFDCTNYYESEMGCNLTRTIASFTGPHPADLLPDAKLACIELEKGLAINSSRTVNLDVGYLDHHKVILASTKEAGHKIYLRDGIYADMVARYANKQFEALAWSFPDFKDGRYNEDLLSIRQRLNYIG